MEEGERRTKEKRKSHTHSAHNHRQKEEKKTAQTSSDHQHEPDRTSGTHGRPTRRAPACHCTKKRKTTTKKKTEQNELYRKSSRVGDQLLSADDSQKCTEEQKGHLKSTCLPIRWHVIPVLKGRCSETETLRLGQLVKDLDISVLNRETLVEDYLALRL